MQVSSPASRHPRGSVTTLAVVVPATDRPPTLARCLAALRAGTRAADEVIVQEDPPGAGPAAARNLAAGRCEADVLVFVDSDVEVHPDALEPIARRFSEDPELTALFGAYDDEPADPALTSLYRNLLHHHVHSTAAGEAETFWAGLGAVRREAFEASGGFDADRFPEASVEDIEFGMRLRRSGAKILLDPEICGRHLKAWTPLRMLHTDFARRGVPWMRLLLRDKDDSTTLNLSRQRRLSALASVALITGLLSNRPRLAAAAMVAGLVLDRDLYALLARRGGPRLLVAGIALHVLHLLTAAASVPVAAALHLRERAAR